MKNTFKLLACIFLLLNPGFAISQISVYDSEFCGDPQNVVDKLCGLPDPFYFQDIEVFGEGIMGENNRGLIEITIDVSDDADLFGNSIEIISPDNNTYYLTDSDAFPGFVPGGFIFSMKNLPNLPSVYDNVGNPNGQIFQMFQNYNDGMSNADGTWLFKTCREANTNYIDINCVSLTFGQLCPEVDEVITTPATCFGISDGSITINATAGVSGEVYYSLDGINFQEENIFEDLFEGFYTVTIAEGIDGDDYTCIFTIDVTVPLGDTEGPTFIDCPENAAIILNDECNATFSLIAPTLEDECGAFSFGLDVTYETTTGSGIDFYQYFSGEQLDFFYSGAGTLTMEWLAGDGSELSSSCFTTIILEDDTAPEFDGNTIPEDVTINVDSDCSGFVTLTHPNIGDNCGFTFQKIIITYPDETMEEQVLDSGSSTEFMYQGTGVMQIDWFLRDIVGNDSHAYTNITLEDDISPEIIDCPEDIIVFIDENCTASITITDPLLSDNCTLDIMDATYTYQDGFMEIFEIVPGQEQSFDDEFGPGEIVIDWFVTDETGNSTACQTIITLIDAIPPTWDVSFVSIQGECGVDNVPDLQAEALQNLIASDNCSSNITYWLAISDPQILDGVCIPDAKYIFSYFAIDESGNLSEEVGTVQIEFLDMTPPTITGIPDDVTIFCGDELPQMPTPSATDECSGDLTSSIEFAEFTTEGSCDFNEHAIIYTYQWTSTDQCENITVEEWNITVVNDVTISLGQDFVGCDGSTYFLSPTGLTGEYAWSTGDDTEVIEIAAEGIYSVTVTSENGCCATSEISVSFEAIPSAVAIGNTITCENQEVQIFGDSDASNVTYAWSGPNAFTSNDQDPLVSVEGDYILIVSTENECSATATATVNTDNDLPDLMATGGSIDCISTSATLAATSSFSGTYAWTGPESYTSTAQNPIVDIPGQYTVVFTAPNGCTASIQVTVEDNITSPQIFGEDGLLDCSTTVLTIELEGGADLDYSWNGPNGFMSTAQKPMIDAPGTYSVIATDMNGCTATETIIISEDIEVPDLDASGGVLTCEQNTTQISASSSTENVTYEWSGPNDFISNDAIVAVGVAGEYTIEITAENGCSTSSTVQVEADENLPAIIASGGTIDCISESIQLMSDTDSEGVSFMWTGPNGFSSTDPNPIVSIPGTYTIQVLAANGCEAQTNVIVIDDTSAPMLTITTPILGCSNMEAMIILESDLESTYEWEGPLEFASTDQNPTIGIPGEYAVTATGINGCVNTETVFVEIDESLPIASLEVDEIDCTNNMITIKADFDDPEYSIEWKKDDSIISTESMISISEAGTYTMMVTGPNGCSIGFSYTLEEDLQALEANITTTESSSGTPGTATIEILNSLLPVTIIWDNGEEGLEATNLETGLHTVTVTDLLGCMYTFEFEIKMFTSTTDVSKIMKWEMYPTLAQNTVSVSALFDKKMKANIIIFDIHGKSLLNQPYEMTAKIESSIDVSNFVPGTYILVLNTKFGRASQRFVKVN